MDDMRRRFYEMTAGPTMTYVDLQKNVILLRGCPAEERAEVLRIIVDCRRSWKTWQTLTQRQWQLTSPRHFRARTVKAWALRAGGIDRAPARVRESIATREQYVRMGN